MPAANTANILLGLAAESANEGTAAFKAAAIAQATISAALAIIRALSDLGPIAGAIAAVGIGASTAAQIAKIASTPIPKAERGGIIEVGGRRHSGGGTTFVGEDGTAFEAEQGELINITSRADAARFNQAELRRSAVLNAATLGATGGDGSTLTPQAQRVFVSETDLTRVNRRVETIETAATL